MNRTDRHARDYRPAPEPLEARTVMSGLVAPQVELRHLGLFGSLGAQLARPNLPVAPFPLASITGLSFIDPSITIRGGTGIVVGTKDYLAPWASLDARNGEILIGSGTTVQDNATLVANKSTIILGDNVLIGSGATVIGNSQIGAPGGSNTSIGPNAVVDGAVVAAGAEVGALARVEPGIVIPTGFAVNPGVDVATQAEASNPALGFVTRLTAPDTILATELSDSSAVAAGYITLYQSAPASASSLASSLATATGVLFGNLAAVEGASQIAGTAVVPFEPAATGPKFPSPNGKVLQGNDYAFPARAIGSVIFSEFPAVAAHKFSRHDSVRADEDLTVTIGKDGHLGKSVTIHPFRGGKITIGSSVQISDLAVLSANSRGNLSVGNNAVIGSGDVIVGSSIGAGTVIGPGSYIAFSTIPAGLTLPAGTFLINTKLVP
jgi:carbonic anhydrase/acetyltransferase-like protein (isoleucine patch superfamily)